MGLEGGLGKGLSRQRGVVCGVVGLEMGQKCCWYTSSCLCLCPTLRAAEFCAV